MSDPNFRLDGVEFVPPFTVLAEVPCTYDYIVGDSTGQYFLCSKEFKEDTPASIWTDGALHVEAGLLDFRVPMAPPTVAVFFGPEPPPVADAEAIALTGLYFDQINVSLWCGFGKASKIWVVSGEPQIGARIGP